MKIRSIWIGFILLAVVMHLGIFGGFADLSIFFNVHALVLVFGGTVGIMLLSYSFSMISEIYDFLVFGFFLKKNSHDIDVVHDLLVSIHKTKSPFFDINNKKYLHNFTKDGITLLRKKCFTADDIYEAMNTRKEFFKLKYTTHGKVLLNISKYPPALGLLGASTGMIQMMMNLGSGGPEAIGKSMAIALTATFWGIGAANFIFLPLADYAYQLAEDDHQIRELISEAIVKEKEGILFESLIEIISFKFTFEKQKLIKLRINQYLSHVEQEEKSKIEKINASNESQLIGDEGAS